MEMWLIFKFIAQTDQGVVAEFQGLVNTETEALAVAEGHADYCIGPAVVGVLLPDETLPPWEGMYYPSLQRAVEGST